MTSEQIEETKKAALWGDTWTLRDEVLRLIEERRRLLEACQAFVDRAKELNVPMTASEVMARNAIHYAEAP